MRQLTSRLVRSTAPCAALFALLLSHAAAVPLLSPWSGHNVALTDAPFACPALPSIAPDLTTDGFYRLDDPTHSIVDPARMAAYKASADPVKAVGLALVREADAFRTTGSKAAAKCAVDHMTSLARQRSLTGKMSSSQAFYVQGWIGGAIAIAYLKVAGSGLLSPDQAHLIGPWLQQIGHATQLWYDEHAARSHDPLGNNHLYWAGVELAAIAVVNDNRKDFDWALATYENGVAQIRPDGTLPLEMARGSKALHYHLYALAPLVLIAEFGEANGTDLYAAHNGALHRLASTSVKGISDPSLFVSITRQPQESSEPVTGDQIGWAPPYLRRFPDPTLARYVQQAPSLSVFYLGGLPPA